MKALHTVVSVFAWCALVVVATSARCQDVAPLAPDTAVTSSRHTYRFRIENSQYGRIEISVDGGERYLVIGRVLKPATLPGRDRAALHPGSIARSGSEGIAVATGPGQIVKVLPLAPPAIRAKAPPCAIITDIRRNTALFGEYGPPAGTGAFQQVGGGAWRPFLRDFTPTEDDVFGFVVDLPNLCDAAGPEAPPPNAEFLARLSSMRSALVALADDYAAEAVSRARESGRPVVSGVVTLNAKVPRDEPEPVVAITYSIDGNIVSAQNTLPSAFGWDTVKSGNGEHVVEIRGLSRYATVVTRVRSLVVVNNP